MLKFLKYFVLLFLVVVVADRLIYFVITKVQSNTYRGIQGGKINHYLGLQKAPTLIIMGPSNAAYQVNPQNFGVPAYNLGHPDTEDAFQTALLSVVINNNKLPKNILLHVNPYAYLGKVANQDFASKSPLKLGYFYAKDPLVTKYINDLGIKERIKYFFRLTRYNNKVIGLAKDFAQTKVSGPIPNGFFAFEPATIDSFNVATDYKKGLTLAKPEFDPADVIQPKKLKYLEEFLALCKLHNINLILFTLPFYPDVVRQRKDELATQMVRSFSTQRNIPYIDFRQTDLSQLINSPAYWKDLQHLNAIGTKLESEYVSATVMPLLVR